MTDEHTIVEARELRTGDVLYSASTQHGEITVDNVVRVFERGVVVTWRDGGGTWDDCYDASARVQLSGRGDPPDVP